MRILITEPSKAYLRDVTSEQVTLLQKQFKFLRTNIRVMLGKHKVNRWFRQNNPEGYEFRLNELKSQLYGTCLFHDGGSHYIRPGSISYIEDIEYTVENLVVYPKLKPMKWIEEPDFNPYPYQSDSVKELLKIKHGNIALPTGCGKSFILLMLTQQMGLKTVIVTPSKSIFNELLTEFQKKLGKSKVGGYGDGKKDIKKPITIAIGKSLANLKEGTPEYKFFQEKEVLKVDESHTFAAEQLNGVCNGVLNKIPYRFFVSATQTRGDGTEKQLHSIIGKTVFEMSLEEAIRLGYLCPLKFLILDVISPNPAVVSDPIKCKRTHFLYNPNIANAIAKISNAVVRINDQSILILVEELKQIQMVTELLNVPYGYVHSASRAKAAEWGLEPVKLQEQVDRFNRGEIKVLIGTRAIATGTNMYPTHFTFNWMGGKSEIITKQGPMGRSTRKLEISKYKDFHVPKPFTMVVDFNVMGQQKLEKHLECRLEYYAEANGDITHKAA